MPQYLVKLQSIIEGFFLCVFLETGKFQLLLGMVFVQLWDFAF